MKMTEKVTNNRDNLIYAIALVEDITRTNNRIYELLKGLMNNPEGLTNIKESIDTLYDKITNLKNSDIRTPLIDEEKVMVPGPEDMSPKEDIEYEKHLQKLTEPTPSTLEPEEETEEELVEEAEEPPKKTRNSRRNVRAKRPRKILRNKKEQSETDLQD